MVKEKGNVLLGVMIMMIAIILFVIFPKMTAIEKKEEIENEFPETTIEDKVLVDEFKKLKEPKKLLEGVYVVEKQSDDFLFRAKFYFTKDKTLVKELFSIDEDGEEITKISGVSEYSFNGSTLQYDYISGAKGIFAEIGDAITIIDDNNFIFHETEDNFHFKREK